MTLIVNLLLKEEGFSPHFYFDTLGFATIGVGRMIDRKKGGGITREEAMYLLNNDIDRIYAAFDVAIPWYDTLNGVRQAVLASMAFQMGVPGLLRFKNTLRAMEEGRYADAAAHMRQSRWYSQTPQRAERAARAMESGLEADLEL